ncbi:hypothetical protein FE257_000723 [Aspergillus nanangensis]|uniref:WD repeat protein n=1 Tax=Aspergillus nanangensis TaxID=2582783 RepID=A0AAD4CF20_ASPNN|nr:hypothetical protein FE257_000723 [Aspergillus nanangensis]
MSRSSHQNDFFQTTFVTAPPSSGCRMQLFLLKILAVRADPVDASAVYVAQSGGTVRKVILETGETAALYKGPTAPVTSICFSPDGRTVFAGCWDKLIWSWDVASREPKFQYEGHTDFVKSVTTTRLHGKDVLVSGGADAQILIFDISSGQRLSVMKGHIKGIQDLMVDPLSLESDGPELVVFSAGSDREIRQFDISTGSKDLTGTDAILAHDTNVHKLFFDQDGDLWTASADRTSKCLVREDGWKPNLTLTHPDYVRDVVVYEQGGWVITACRDEEVRVWNRSTGQLYHTFSGHYEEVTGLVLQGSTVVSVGIDATIRRWSLRPEDLQIAVENAKKKPEVEEEKQENAEPMLTEEEERELAELMGDD